MTRNEDMGYHTEPFIQLIDAPPAPGVIEPRTPPTPITDAQPEGPLLSLDEDVDMQLDESSDDDYIGNHTSGTPPYIATKEALDHDLKVGLIQTHKNISRLYTENANLKAINIRNKRKIRFNNKELAKHILDLADNPCLRDLEDRGQI